MSYEFTCKKSLTCIPKYDVCNSFNDCEDGSDEVNCTNVKNESKYCMLWVVY